MASPNENAFLKSFLFKQAVDVFIQRYSGSIDQLSFEEIQGYEPSSYEIEYLVENLIGFPGQGYDLNLNGIKFSSETFNYFMKMLKLLKLDTLSVNFDSQFDLSVLNGISKLTISTLNLSNSRINDINLLIQFVKNNNIKTLNLSNCNIRDEEAVIVVHQLNSYISCLYLSLNNITDRGAHMIAQSLTNVYVEHIYFNSELIVKNDFELYKFKTFSLYLNGNDITGRGRIRMIRSLSGQQKVKLSFSFLDKFIKRILNNVKLDSLIFTNDKDSGNTILTDDNLDFIISRLNGLGLKELTIENREISDAGIDKLFQALLDSKIVKLNLQSNCLSQISANIIANNISRQITHLNLAHNNFGADGILPIINAIPNLNLTELNLSFCNIDDKLLTLLCKALKLSSIIKLNLTGNKLSLESIKTLTETIPESKLRSITGWARDPPSDSIHNKLDIIICMFNTAIQHKICEFNFSSPINPRNYFRVLQSMSITLKDYYLLTEFSFEHHDRRIAKHIERNKQLLSRAAVVVDSFQNDSIEFNDKFANDLLSFQLLADHYQLWIDIPNCNRTKKRISRKINENYFQIAGIVKHKLTALDNKNHTQKGIYDMPHEILTKISSYLYINDVKL